MTVNISKLSFTKTGKMRPKSFHYIRFQHILYIREGSGEEGSNVSTVRKVQEVLASRPTIGGSGVHLKGVFGNNEAPSKDLFLLLDDFH